MPVVNGKHYPYTQKGKKMAKKARERAKKSNYRHEDTKMAMDMIKNA